MKDNHITSSYLPNNDVHVIKHAPKFYLLHLVRDVLAVIGGIWVLMFICAAVVYVKG